MSQLSLKPKRLKIHLGHILLCSYSRARVRFRQLTLTAACALDHVRCAHGGLNERSLSAIRAESSDWNSEFSCLVAKIFLNARVGEMMTLLARRRASGRCDTRVPPWNDGSSQV